MPSMATVHMHKGPSPPPGQPPEDDDTPGLLLSKNYSFQVGVI